jgi:hypothetical protein
MLSFVEVNQVPVCELGSLFPLGSMAPTSLARDCRERLSLQKLHVTRSPASHWKRGPSRYLRTRRWGPAAVLSGHVARETARGRLVPSVARKLLLVGPKTPLNDLCSLYNWLPIG